MPIIKVKENTKWMFRTEWDFHKDAARVEVVSGIDKNSDDVFSILDVGCATGKTLEYLKEKYPKAKLYGIEPDRKPTANPDDDISIFDGTIEEYISGHINSENLFDYIIFSDVLEHLLQPWIVLRDIRKFLKPGGKILASIPNVGFIAVVVNLLHGRFPYGSEGIVNKDHIRFFTLYEIIQMFDNCGYKNICYGMNMIALTEELKEFIKILEKTFGKHPWPHYETYQYIMKVDK